MYKRTTLGNQEILARNLKLSARLRTLLLLIESDDFKKLDARIANPQHFSTLLELGLIILFEEEPEEIQMDDADRSQFFESKQPATSNMNSTDENKIITQSVLQTAINKEADIVANKDNFLNQFDDMSFADIRDLMRDTLKQYCGLMAKNLILAIENSHSVQDLRYHQKKWLTSLFETKIPRQRLTVLLQHINHHLQNIDS